MAVFLKTAKAEEDLIEIWLYVAQDNPAAADNLLDTIEEKGWLLADNRGWVRRDQTLLRTSDTCQWDDI